MKRANPRRKPTGTIGSTLLSPDPLAPKVEFQRLTFPEEKEAIEGLIARGFMLSAKKHGLLPAWTRFSPNEQDDLDFALHLGDGKRRQLELMEIAPLEDGRGSFETAESSYRTYDRGKYVLGKILGKSAHYGSNSQGASLLTYVTDWRFFLSGTVVRLLQYWLLGEAHCFERIFYYSPISPDEGIAQVLSPVDAVSLEGFDPEEERESTVYSCDPIGWRSGVRRGGAAVSARKESGRAETGPVAVPLSGTVELLPPVARIGCLEPHLEADLRKAWVALQYLDEKWALQQVNMGLLDALYLLNGLDAISRDKCLEPRQDAPINEESLRWSSKATVLPAVRRIEGVLLYLGSDLRKGWVAVQYVDQEERLLQLNVGLFEALHLRDTLRVMSRDNALDRLRNPPEKGEPRG